jgi:hypothetical protein
VGQFYASVHFQPRCGCCPIAYITPYCIWAYSNLILAGLLLTAIISRINQPLAGGLLLLGYLYKHVRSSILIAPQAMRGKEAEQASTTTRLNSVVGRMSNFTFKDCGTCILLAANGAQVGDVVGASAALFPFPFRRLNRGIYRCIGWLHLFCWVRLYW